MYDRRNRYLQDRAMRKSDMARGRGRDMRDYGRGDYRDNRGMYDSRYDSRMDSRDYNSEYNSRRDYRDYRDYGNEDPNKSFKYNREHTRNDMYQMYGAGFITPTRDYRMDYNDDYRYDYGNDYDHEEKEYKHHLHEWIEKLKQKDRIKIPKEQVLRQAKNMKIEFKDFDEDEFYAIYLMHISDYPEKSNVYNYYISMAKDWLEDDDVYYKGGDKVCSYLYHTVLGK